MDRKLSLQRCYPARVKMPSPQMAELEFRLRSNDLEVENWWSEGQTSFGN